MCLCTILFQCCDAIVQRSNKGNVLKFVNTEKVNEKVDSEELVPAIAKITVKERPTQALLNQNTVNLATNKPAISNKIQIPTSIKLTQAGSQFLKHLENSINIHPILGRNSKVIKELLNEAILNATNALKNVAEKQVKPTENVEKTSAGTVTVITKPVKVNHTSNTIHTTDDKQIEIKERNNTPTSHKIVEIPPKINNDQKMIMSNDNSKKIKFNATETVMHDDKNPPEHLTNEIKSAKQENLCSTKVGIDEHNSGNKVEISFRNDPKAKIDRKELDTSPVVTHKVDILSANKINKMNPTHTQEKLIKLSEPNSKAVSPQPTVENEIELPLFEDEIGKYLELFCFLIIFLLTVIPNNQSIHFKNYQSINFSNHAFLNQDSRSVQFKK